MAEKLEFSFRKSYEKAENMLKEKDLVSFMETIGMMTGLFTSKELLAKTLFLKVKGLYEFRQLKKALEIIPQAIKYCNEKNQLLQLKKYKGLILGFLGKLKKAEIIFTEILEKITETDKKDFLVEMCLNLTWVSLLKQRTEPQKENLENAKKFLDIAYSNFESLTNRHKIKICNNYSIYHYYKKEYDESIKFLEKALEFCEEKDLPKIYNNLAEIYLKSDENEVSELVKEYSKKAELIGAKYGDKLAQAKAFYTNAMIAFRENQFFTALDTFYLSFEHFKDAEAYTYSLECVQEINKILKKIGKLATNANNLALPENNYHKETYITKFLKTNNFNQHIKLLEFVARRINNENHIEIMNLKIYEGVVKGYLGNLNEAIKIFKDVIDHAKDQTIFTTSCLNIAWLYMGLDRQTLDEHKLTEAKNYLDLVNDQFTSLTNDIKYNLLSNYSVYYYLKNNYRKSIDFLENSIKYCEEKYLADLYNNIAELYINSADDNSFSDITRDYLEKAEGLGTKYNEKLSLHQY